MNEIRSATMTQKEAAQYLGLSGTSFIRMKESNALYGIGIHEMRKIFYEEKVPILKIGRKTIFQHKGLDDYLDEIASSTTEIR